MLETASHPAAAYLLFALLVVFAPGVSLQRILGLPVDPALVIPLGFTFAAFVWGISLATGAHALFPIVVFAVLVGGFLRKASQGAREGPSLLGAVAPLLVLAAVLALTRSGVNELAPSGEFIIETLAAHDNAVHAGTTWELTLGYPPQVPGLSGTPFAYHFGADLVRAAALRFALVSPYDAMTRFEPFLGLIGLVLALRGVCFAMGLGPRVIQLAPWTLLATNLSYLLPHGTTVRWWADLLPGNLLMAWVMGNNANVPALATLLAALISLRRFDRFREKGALAVALVLAFAVPWFKVFFGAQLFVAFLVAAWLVPSSRRSMLLAAGASGLATSLLVGGARESVAVVFEPLSLVQAARQALGLGPAEGWHLLAWTAAWIGASLGLRLLAVGPAVRAMFSHHPTAIAVSAVALSGWPIMLLFRISLREVLEGARATNDVWYFGDASGALLWIFAVAGLVSLPFPRPLSPGLAIWAGALLSLPSTAQFMVEKSRMPTVVVPAEMMRAMAALAQESRPGDVVLEARRTDRYPPPPVVFIGRRVPYASYFTHLSRFASADELSARRDLVDRFFQTSDAGEARDILRHFRARFVLVTRWPLRFDPAGLLSPVFDEFGAQVFRVNAEAVAEGPSPPN